MIYCLPHERRDELVTLAQGHIKDRSPATLRYIVPARLRQEEVRLALAGDGGFLPFVGTVADLARELYPAARPGHRVMSVDQQTSLLERVLEEVWGQLGYLRREGASRPSLGLVSDLLRLFSEVRGQDRDLAAELGVTGGPRDADLLLIWNAYLARHEEMKVTDTAGAMRWLAREDPDVVSPVTLVLLDTLPPEPPPVEEAFLGRVCGKAGRAVARRVVCPGMSKVFSGETPGAPASAGDGYADVICARMFRPPFAGEPRDPEDLSSTVMLLTAPGREGEMELVASCIRSLLDDGVPPGSITVVFPLPKLYAPFIEAVFPRYGIPFTPGAGMPLRSTGPARAVLAILDCVRSGFCRDDVMRLLRSPYVSFSHGGEGLDTDHVLKVVRRSSFSGGRDGWARMFRRRVQRQELRAADVSRDERSRRHAASEAEKDRVQGAAVDALLERLGTLTSPMRATDLARGLRSLMDELHITDLPAGDEARLTRDGRAVRAVHKLLNDLEAAASLLGDDVRDPEQVQGSFRSMMAGRRFASRAWRGDVVQVMGIGEAQATGNDHVFLCGLVEKDYPHAGTPSIVPSDPDAARGLFDRAHEMRRQRYLFLLAATAARKRLHLSRPTTLGGDPAIASIFLDEMERRFVLGPVEDIPRVPTVRSLLAGLGAALTTEHPLDRELLLALGPGRRAHAVHASRVENLLRAAGSETPYTGIIGDPQLRDLLRERYGERSWTATELETYAKCPFGFMARYIWHLRGEDEPSAEMTPLEFGTLVHDVLARFLTGLRMEGIELAHGDEDDLLSYLRTSVKDVLAESGGTGVVWKLVGEELCSTGRRQGALTRWLRTETGSPLPGPGPRFMELGMGAARGVSDPLSLTGPVEVALPAGDGVTRTLRFTGKVDRIDVDPDTGDGVILDYKTGAGSAIAPKDIKTGRSVQLTLYPLMVEAAVRNGLLAKGPANIIASGIYRVSPRAPIERKLLAVSGAKDRLKGEGTCFYRGKMETLRDRSIESIIRSVDGILGSRFPASDETKSAGCVHCVARHVCRSPHAEVARSW